MDGAVVVAALILNPIARRKRARAPELVQVIEAPIVSVLTNGDGGSSTPEKSDPELGEKPIVIA